MSKKTPPPTKLQIPAIVTTLVTCFKNLLIVEQKWQLLECYHICQLWLFVVAGFEKLTPQNHLSAVETLRQSKPSSAPPRSKFPDDICLNSDAENSLLQCSLQKYSLPVSEDVTTGYCTGQRVVNGKRRLSTGHRDDSASGCERQRKYFGNVQRKLSPSYLPNESQPETGSKTPSMMNDSAISNYLSFKVEHMDLQSDVPGVEKPPSPKWLQPDKIEAPNVDTNNDRRSYDPDVVRSFMKYRHGPYEMHRSGGRRYRKPSGGRAGTLTHDTNCSARRRDDKKLEAFFSQMGMDSRTFSATLSGSSMSAFENVSSIDTSTLESRTSYAESERVDEVVLDPFDVSERDTVVCSSIVERNARIIKWLCSIRKASAGDDIPFDEGFV